MAFSDVHPVGTAGAVDDGTFPAPCLRFGSGELWCMKVPSDDCPSELRAIPYNLTTCYDLASLTKVAGDHDGLGCF